MEPNGSLPYLQQLASYYYPEPAEFSPQPVILFFSFVLSSHLCIGLPDGLFLLDFPSKLYVFLFSFINATYPTHFLVMS